MIIDFLYTFGSSMHGQLGLGIDKLLNKDAYVTVPTPIKFPKDSNFKQVECGFDHTVILTG